MKTCAHPECTNKFKDHCWGRIKAEGWFHQRDGQSWCPEHIPAWVKKWRNRKG